jgi:hypothetical protein
LERQKNYSNEEILTLFEESIPTINKQMANLYKHGEIATAATIRKFRIVQTESFAESEFEKYRIIKKLPNSGDQP